MKINKRWYVDLFIATIISQILWYFIAGGASGILIGLIDAFALFLGVLGIHNLIIRVGKKYINIWMIFFSTDITVLLSAIFISAFGYDEELKRVSFAIALAAFTACYLLVIIWMGIEEHYNEK